MKILLVRSTANELRSESYNVQEIGLAKALSSLGHECSVLFWTKGRASEEKIGNVRVYRRRAFALLGCALFDEDDLMRQADIIQANEYSQAESFRLVGRYPQKMVLYHGPYSTKADGRYRPLAAIADKLYVPRYIRRNTKFIAKSPLAASFLRQRKIERVFPLGVGLDETPFLSLPARKSNSSPHLLYVGSLQKRRNIPFILQTAAVLKAHYPDFTLTLCGAGKPDYEEACAELIRKLGLGDRVIRRGKVTQAELSSLYAESDFFLLPTSYEIFGMVLLESMYCGVVPITTYAGGSAMLVRDGENGFLPPFTPEAWAERIAATFADEKKLLAMRQAAKSTVENGFLWQKLAPSFVKVYEC